MSVRVFGRVEEFLRASLVDPVERDHRQSSGDFRRRQVVTAVFTVLGTGVLGWGLNVEPGSSWFYVATFALAAVWTVGAFASGPLHIGRIDGRPAPRRPILAPLVLGLGLAAVFVLGALVVREIGALEGAVDDVLAFARQGSGPLVMVVAVVNGVAEELFFRGTVMDAFTNRYAVIAATAVYAVVTSAGGNVALVLAAVVMGAVFAVERRWTRSLVTPIVTHLTWSVLVITAFPRR